MPVDGVGLYPLQEDAALFQAALDRLVVLTREQTGNSCTVGIGRFGGDDGVGLAPSEQILARVAEDHPVFRIVHGVVVDRGAGARNLQNGRFEFDRVDPLDGGDGGQPAGGAAGA